MFLIFKRKTFLLCITITLSLLLIITLIATHKADMPKPILSLVIDAGHGGIDKGTSGKTTGVSESDLNLKYALALKEMCEDFNIKVILTRKDENGLYSPAATNKKRSEMEKRKQIIEDSKADLVISIHMNSFPLSSAHGAQVFYAKENKQGKSLAQNVNNSIVKTFPTARKNASVGDYFVLNCTPKPAILIEFGYLSNPEEEVLLQQNDYMKSMCYSVLDGIINYYKM